MDKTHVYHVSYGFRQNSTTGSYLVRAKTAKSAVYMIKSSDDRKINVKATRYRGPDTKINDCIASDLVSDNDLAKLGKYEGGTLHLEEGN